LQRRKALGARTSSKAGFAGAHVARLLGEQGSTIVSRENFRLFTPILPEAAMPSSSSVGQLPTTAPRKRCMWRRRGWGPTEVRYERLVVALGAVARTLPIPGLTEHALGFKSLADAIYLRNHVLRQLGMLGHPEPLRDDS
jgi:NADH dehydrogenase